MVLLCTEFSWVSNKCCWDKFGRGWSCRYMVWIAICFLNNRTLSFIPCSYISGHCFLVHRKCWYSLSINGDDQWCALISFFKIQKPCISHPKELQVVPNYAFPWKVYAEKNQSIPKFLSEDITLLTSLWTWTCSKVEIHEAVTIKQGTLTHKFSRLVTSMTKLTKCMHIPSSSKFPCQGNFLPKSEAIAPNQKSFSGEEVKPQEPQEVNKRRDISIALYWNQHEEMHIK